MRVYKELGVETVTLDNVKRAEQYQLKAKLLGQERLNLQINKDNGTVGLVTVKDGEGTLEIPNFVSWINRGAFAKTHYNVIDIKGKILSFNSVFAYMKSSKLKVIYPFDNLKVISDAFKYAKSLEELDLSECNLSNVKEAEFAFFLTPKLRQVVFGKNALKSAVNIKSIFKMSGLKSLDCNEVFGDSITKISGAFEESEIKSINLGGLCKAGTSEALQKEVFMGFLPEGLETLRMRSIPDWDYTYKCAEGLEGQFLAISLRALSPDLQISNLHLDEEQPRKRVEQFMYRIGQVKAFKVYNGHNSPVVWFPKI